MQMFGATAMLLPSLKTSVLKEVHILCPLSPQQHYNPLILQSPK